MQTDKSGSQGTQPKTGDNKNSSSKTPDTGKSGSDQSKTGGSRSTHEGEKKTTPGSRSQADGVNALVHLSIWCGRVPVLVQILVESPFRALQTDH